MAVKKGYRQSPEHIQRRMAARLATLKAKPKPVSRAWLHREYIERRRDCAQIGAELGKDPKTIWSWLRFYGIPTRSRGAMTSRTPFQKGQPSAFKGRRHTPEARERVREARLRDGHVPYLRNGVHWLTEVGAERHPNWKGGVTPERQAFCATSEWKLAVRAVWERSNAFCERCGLDYRSVRDEKAFHVHHVESFAIRELRAAVDNLRLLCIDCHRFIHSRANTDRELWGGQSCR